MLVWYHSLVRRDAQTQKGRGKPYVLVSFASFCMISRIILQAAEQPSGVEWMLMAFSAAPAFSFRCTSILEAQDGSWGGGSSSAASQQHKCRLLRSPWSSRSTVRLYALREGKRS